jgi:hypothetical protein
MFSNTAAAIVATARVIEILRVKGILTSEEAAEAAAPLLEVGKQAVEWYATKLGLFVSVPETLQDLLAWPQPPAHHEE